MRPCHVPGIMRHATPVPVTLMVIRLMLVLRCDIQNIARDCRPLRLSGSVVRKGSVGLKHAIQSGNCECSVQRPCKIGKNVDGTGNGPRLGPRCVAQILAVGVVLSHTKFHVPVRNTAHTWPFPYLSSI